MRRRSSLLIGALPLICACSDAHGARDAAVSSDTRSDAWTPPPAAPELVFRSAEAGVCPRYNRPHYFGIPGTGERGRARWIRDVTVGPGILPTFVAEGSLWTSDRWSLDYVDHITGEEEPGFYTTPDVSRPTMDEGGTVWRYKYAPMSLGESLIVSRDAFGLWFVDLSSVADPRSLSFPEVEAMIDRRAPLPAPNLELEHVMPAWSPATGQIAYTVGYDNAIVAVMCPVDGGGQLILRFAPRPETGYRGTRVYYRANGELLVHRGGLHVISPTGELLRSASPSATAEPYAYAEGCGVLYQDGTEWFWFDPDSLSAGPRADLSEYRGAAGSASCALRAGSSEGVFLVLPGSERPAVRLAAAGVGAYELGDGRFVRLDQTTRELAIVDAGGAVVEPVVRLSGDVNLVGGPYWTPDGHVIFTSGGLWELDLPAPGPMLWPEAGMNWAHTNSPLPE